MPDNHRCPDCNTVCDCPLYDETGICEGCEELSMIEDNEMDWSVSVHVCSTCGDDCSCAMYDFEGICAGCGNDDSDIDDEDQWEDASEPWNYDEDN